MQMFCNLPAFIGTKVIGAEPMTKDNFDTCVRGVVADVESYGVEGYHVQYTNPDGGVYDSWSPKNVFDEAYRSLDGGLTFGDALFFLKQGKKVARKGWNGKGMWIVYMSGMTLPAFSDQTAEKRVNDRTAALIGKDTPLVTLPYIAMWTADGKWLPGWLASQTDMLSEDWYIVE